MVTKPNPPLLRNGSKRFTKLKPVLKHNGALQKEDQEEREVRVHEGRGGDIMIIEGYARPAPLPGSSVPISNVPIDPHFANAPPGYQSVSEVITDFQNGTLTAEAAVDILIYQFNMSRPNATNMVFSASSQGQDLDEWVEGAEEQFKENLTDPDYTGPVPSPPPSPEPSTPEDNGIPTLDPSARGLQIIPKDSNIPMMALGAFILFVVGKNLNSVVRA